MKSITGMTQNFRNFFRIKRLKIVPKTLADLLRSGALLPGFKRVILIDIVALQACKSTNWRLKACGGHSPGADRCPDQMNGLLTLGEPVTEKKTINWTQDEAFRTPGSAGNHLDMVRQKTVFSDVRQGSWSGVDAKRWSSRSGH